MKKYDILEAMCVFFFIIHPKMSKMRALPNNNKNHNFFAFAKLFIKREHLNLQSTL